MSACPAIDAWEELVSGRLPAADAEPYLRHADVCASCCETLARLRRNQALIGPLRHAWTAPTPQLIGRRIGSYQVTGVLGSGGMATVYQAVQDNPRRVVALKVLARGLSSETSLARFRQEAELLGRLHHHGIAQVFEAGTEDDGGGPRPYFAMELVRGRTLAEHASAAALNRAARLELLARVCDAVQYAHEHGVVHRDLKPSNIMVDENGQPKVLDFGVARAATSDARTTALRTEPGQLVGTLAYMSPEQAAGAEKDVDARADVYALGVICYELVTGQAPLDLRTLTPLEALQAIKSAAPRPPGTIDRSLRGDLEVILGAAMEKDPSRRYPSAAALASDLRRFLDRVPISARPATALYRLSAFARRNRPLVGAAAAVFATLLLGLAGTAYGLWRSERRRATAEAVSTLLESALSAANPHEVKGAGYTVRQLIDEVSRGLHDRLSGQPEVESRVRTTLGNAYRVMGEPAKARAHLEAALMLRRGMFRPQDPAVARTMVDLAWVLHDQADYAAAAALLREALAAQAAGPVSGESAAARMALSDVLRHTGEFEESASLGNQALAIRRSLGGDNDPETAECLSNLSKLARDRGDLAGAEQALDLAMAIWEARYGPEHPRLVDGLNDKAWLLYRRGDLQGAEQALDRSVRIGRAMLGAHHPDVGNAIYEWGVIREARGDGPGAEEKLRDALAIYRTALGDANPSVWSTLDALAQLLIRSRRDYVAAEPLAREALEGRRALFGPRAGETALSTDTVARILNGAGRKDEAEAMFREAIAALTVAYGPDHSYVAISQHNLGALLQERSDWSGAEAAFGEAVRINRASLGPRHPDTLLAATSLARLLNSRERFADAEAIIGPLAMDVEAGPQSARVGSVLEAHAAALRGLGRNADAAEQYSKASAVLTAALGPDNPRAIAALESLAGLYETMHLPDKARQIREEIAARKRRP